MSGAVKIDDLAAVIAASLEEYTAEVTEGIKADVKSVGRECRENIARDSPRGKREAKKYADSWKVKNESSSLTAKATVYNTQSGLPHVLEFGHQTRNGGRTKPQPHIKPNEKKAAEELQNRVEKRLRDGH